MFQPNATLTFRIAKSGGTVTRDPVTGAPIQQMEIVVVKASMEAVKDPNQTVALGVDSSALYLEGRLVEPKYFTEAMRFHKTVDMTLRRGENTELKGRFYLLPFSGSRLKLEKFFNDFICGYFQLGG